MAYVKGKAKTGGRKPGAKGRKKYMLQTIAEINAQHKGKDGEGFNPYRELIEVYFNVKEQGMVKTQVGILKEIMMYTYPQLKQVEQTQTEIDANIINIKVEK